jgi:hypothetical protein
MKVVVLTLLHLTITAAKLCGPGGVRAVVAENLVLKQQLIVLRRRCRRAPNLTVSERLVCGVGSLFLRPGRIRKVAIGVRPATLLAFHRALVRRKYRRLFSSAHRPRKPGPKGPSEALIRAIVELKTRNPRFGCPRIARIISQTFGVDVDKNIVRRVLAQHYKAVTRERWALVAVVHRTHDRQPVERRSVSLRVHHSRCGLQPGRPYRSRPAIRIRADGYA